MTSLRVLLASCPALRFLLGGQPADVAEHLHDQALAAEILDAELFEGLEVLDPGQLVQSLFADLFELFKHGLRQGRFGHPHDGVEAGGIGDRDLAEHLAIQRDLGLLEPLMNSL